MADKTQKVASTIRYKGQLYKLAMDKYEAKAAVAEAVKHPLNQMVKALLDAGFTPKDSDASRGIVAITIALGQPLVDSVLEHMHPPGPHQKPGSW